MFPTMGRVVFVTLAGGDEVTALVRGQSHGYALGVIDVTAFPNSGPEAVRLNGVCPGNGEPNTWRWPPRVPA